MSARLAGAAPAGGLDHRVIAGYQGWYGCPGDAPGNTQWQYWFPKEIAPAGYIADVLPALQGIDPAHRCDTQLPRADGHGTVELFSAQDPVVVQQHFAWMRDGGIDTAAVQRFSFALADPVKKARMDRLLDNVRRAAEATGRSFFIVYDISGANAATVTRDLRQDWHHLVDDLRLTKSPAYLHDRGRPVLELWGFGLGDRPGEPADVQALVNDLHGGAGGLRSVTLIGGVPTEWRTLSHDAKSDPAWGKVYRSFDVISPWTVGRYATAEGYEAYRRDRLAPDLAEAHRLGLRYLPVLYPGYSHANAARYHGKSLAFNTVPRDCGRFYWRQWVGASAAGADAVYLAMFDEVGEGTALFPLETDAGAAPAGATMAIPDGSGCGLPADGYLRLTALAAGYVATGRPVPADAFRAVRP